MGSMHTGLEDRFWNYGRLARYFAERAAGGVGLMVTGGYSPNRAGWLGPFSGTMNWRSDIFNHRRVTAATHAEGGKICMQILHAGRYGHHPCCVSASPIKSRISRFTPRELSDAGVEKQIAAYVRSAKLARQAGYDGVEVMGSEGYFINQFLCTRTNRREDSWGGSFENRMRLPVEIVSRIRQAVGSDFIIIYRLSMADFVENGSDWSEIVALGKAVEQAGATLINTGIGWHEARIPTIVTSVPQAAFTSVTRKFRDEVSIPVITSNRINTPELAEQVLSSGDADMVSMARPFLADADFVNKARKNQSELINTCIACNQACLDHVFEMKKATCLVNPRACRETELVYELAAGRKRIAVVGSGPAGLSTAVVSAERGHEVTLFEASDEIGGQFNLAKDIPGKEDFKETLRYYQKQLAHLGVEVKLSTRIKAIQLAETGFDEVIVATGVEPRHPNIPGIEHNKVITYPDLITGKRIAGHRVAIIGAGGIGYDVAQFLTHSDDDSIAKWYQEWGVDPTFESRGALQAPRPQLADREVVMLQRSTGRFGRTLGKTTGWVHRAHLKMKGVRQIAGVKYLQIDDAGLHIETGPEEAREQQVLEVDNIVICAGQLSVNALAEELKSVCPELPCHVIGGALEAGELDAKRAIRQGAELAAKL